MLCTKNFYTFKGYTDGHDFIPSSKSTFTVVNFFKPLACILGPTENIEDDTIKDVLMVEGHY